MRLSEELLLFLLDERTGEFSGVPDRILGYALAGATLMDLSMADRIDSDLNALILLDATPARDALLDPTLADIAEAASPRIRSCPGPDFWVRRVAGRSHELRETAMARLVERGILDTDDGAGIFSLTPWVARTRRYPVVDETQEREIRSRIMGILFTDDVPTPEEVCIVSLVHACGAFERILTPSEYTELQERIELVARLDLIGQAVAGAVRTVSVAYREAMRQRIRSAGGGWPVATGRLPVLGHALHLKGNLRALAGQDANLFMIREGTTHLRSWEQWSGFSHEVGTPRVVTGMDGADHFQLRRAMKHGYSRKFFLSQIPMAVAAVDQELEEWAPETAVGGLDLMQRVATDQICQLAAGTPAREYIGDARRFMSTLSRVYLFEKAPRLLMRMPGVRRSRRRLEQVFEQILAAHEPELRVDSDRDLIDDLMELHTSEAAFMGGGDLFINVIGPFLLGLDTVASSSAFLLYEVLRDPELTERVRAEADELFAGGGVPTPEKLQTMAVTRRAMLETLRMYPIAPVLFRTVTNSFDFGSYHVPAGTKVLLALSVTHYLEEFFPDPERFDIDRYLPERAESSQAGVFTPFGLGRHACLGQGLAQVQMVLNLATLLHRAVLSLDPPGYRLKIDHSLAPKPARQLSGQVAGPALPGAGCMCICRTCPWWCCCSGWWWTGRSTTT